MSLNRQAVVVCGATLRGCPQVAEQILTGGKTCVCIQCGDSKCGGQGELVGVGSLLIASMNELNKSEGDHAGCLKREKM